MTVTSPAKINWFLYILNKREDGFHEILSPVQKISLYDSLTFELTDNIQLTDNSRISDNIILETIDYLKKYRPVKRRGIHITLNKEIPLSSGLGGGSSNAAVTLVTLNQLWSTGIRKDELLSIAAEIGSDVPFFLGDGFSVMKGRGDRIDPHNVDQTYDVLLVNPRIEVSAKWAYEKNKNYVDVRDESKIIEEFINAYNSRDFVSMDVIMSNTIEAPVFRKYPEIKEIKEQLKKIGAKLSLMSGSGSTVFGVFEDRESAFRAQRHFCKYWTRVVKTL